MCVCVCVYIYINIKDILLWSWLCTYHCCEHCYVYTSVDTLVHRNMTCSMLVIHWSTLTWPALYCLYTGPPEKDLSHTVHTLVHPNMSHIVYMLVHGIMTCHMLFYALVRINMTCPVLFAHRSTLTKPVPFRFDALVHLNMICTMLCIQWLPPEHDLLHASM